MAALRAPVQVGLDELGAPARGKGHPVTIAVLAAVTGGAPLLMATGCIDYPDTAPSEALTGLRARGR